jgi:hypothetical protein
MSFDERYDFFKEEFPRVVKGGYRPPESCVHLNALIKLVKQNDPTIKAACKEIDEDGRISASSKDSLTVRIMEIENERVNSHALNFTVNQRLRKWYKNTVQKYNK